MEELNTKLEAFPSDKADQKALAQYFAHTGHLHRSEKLSAVNPSLDRLIRGKDRFVGGGSDTSDASLNAQLHSLAQLKAKAERSAKQRRATTFLKAPKAELSVDADAEAQVQSLASAPNLQQDHHKSRAELEAAAKAGEEAWAKLQQLHEGGQAGVKTPNGQAQGHAQTAQGTAQLAQQARQGQNIRYFEAPNGQVVETVNGQVVAPQQQLQQAPQQPQVAQSQQVQYYETPTGQVVEAAVAPQQQPTAYVQGQPQMNMVPNSQSQKLSEDTDALDGSTGMVQAEPLEDPTAKPENMYTAVGTAFPTQVTVSASPNYVPVQPNEEVQVGPNGVVPGAGTYYKASPGTEAHTQELAQVPHDDPFEGTYKITG